MHPIEVIAYGAVTVIAGMLAIGTVVILFDSWRQQKAEDEFWDGYIVRDNKLNPDYTDRYRVYRMLGTYKSVGDMSDVE
tara:strand:- start:677 stop:913 length:237 start_codon:yes stop_codon:yes gene_type:complete